MRPFITTLIVVLVLCGLGLAQSSVHSVTVNFLAPDDATASSAYNAYRADGKCPASGSPTGQVRLNATPFTGLQYTDITVAVSTYCYTVRHVLAGMESVDSVTVEAKVLPHPPTQVTSKQP